MPNGLFIQALSTNPRYFFAVVLSVVISICLHELSHGIVAIWFGDHTPIEQERMTLSPLVHMGLFSIIVMLLAGIAWGAMPVDRTRLRGKYAEAAVAFAGPLCNILLALLALTALGLWWRFDQTAAEDLTTAAENGQFLLSVFGTMNILLALFNLIPLPPLDGSHILGNFSESFDRTVNGLYTASPIAFMQFSILLFTAAGTLMTPAAVKIAQHYLLWLQGS